MKPDDMLSRRPGVMEARISEDELVLLGVGSESYYGLDAIASDVWGRLEAPMRFADLVAALAAEYDAPPETIAADLGPTLSSLSEGGLIEIVSAG